MTLIEQIRADREAGTPGDKWVVGDRGASIYIEGDYKPYAYGERVGGVVHDYDTGTDLEFSDADFDRIFRVPQLEAIALAAGELVNAIEAEINLAVQDMGMQINAAQRVESAIEALRETLK